jgi:hypothetical protein
MGQVIDLDKKFNEYFYEVESYATRAERFYEELENSSPERMTEWLKAAFMMGARVMAQDTIDTLYDYGTAVAGLTDTTYIPSEAYDNSAHSLMVYYARLFDDKK